MRSMVNAAAQHYGPKDKQPHAKPTFFSKSTKAPRQPSLRNTHILVRFPRRQISVNEEGVVMKFIEHSKKSQNTKSVDLFLTSEELSVLLKVQEALGTEDLE